MRIACRYLCQVEALEQANADLQAKEHTFEETQAQAQECVALQHQVTALEKYQAELRVCLCTTASVRSGLGPILCYDVHVRWSDADNLEVYKIKKRRSLLFKMLLSISELVLKVDKVGGMESWALL